MDQKISLLVNRQVPEFVRDEYPLFVSFLEAYYEFLENKQSNENNDLTTKLKSFRTIMDVDESIDEFEAQFLNTFASMMPVDADVDKAFLIKNILPLYQAKGSENAFKFLFRMLFSKEAEIIYPKDNILRASSGKWKIDSTLKVSTSDISSFYLGDGTKNEFKLIAEFSQNELEIYIDDVFQSSGFKVLKEYNLLVFDSPVQEGSKLEVFYTSVNRNIFNNRKMIGVKSGASVVVEKVFSTISDNEPTFELYVDSKTLMGNFEIGELLETNVFVGNELINVRLRTLSKLKSINVSNSGSNYNVGDPVLIVTTGSERQPTAIVSSVYKSTFETLNIIEGGAGFQVGSNVTIGEYSPPFIDIEVNSVFLESPNTANTFRVFSDIISDIDPANTTIANMSYGLSGPLSGNVNTVIAHCFSNTTFTGLGEIIGLQINSVEVVFNSVPTLNAEPASVIIPKIGSTQSNTRVYIDSYGSLGKLFIYDGGQNYSVGDEIIFTNQPAQFGIGAEAEVREVDANGMITIIEFLPPKISGTVNAFSTNVSVVGTNTYFESELRVGDLIWINGQDKTVAQITSNTSLNVNSTFESSSSNTNIRLYGKRPVGGANYEQDRLPSVSVSSLTGSGANVVVLSIMGDGEFLQPNLGNNKPGGIETITVEDPGKSLLVVPEIDLSLFGDGTATAEAVLIPSFEELPGKWISSDGLISDRNMKLQGLDYYIDFSYVMSSAVEFKKYKRILKELLHPGGSKAYAEMVRLDVINTPQVNVVSQITQESV